LISTRLSRQDESRLEADDFGNVLEFRVGDASEADVCALNLARRASIREAQRRVDREHFRLKLGEAFHPLTQNRYQMSDAIRHSLLACTRGNLDVLVTITPQRSVPIRLFPFAFLIFQFLVHFRVPLRL
jgi:hypothetical protein